MDVCDEVAASLKMSLTTLIEIAVYIKVTSLYFPFICNITYYKINSPDKGVQEILSKL